jgi:hypothetical protein
VAAVTQAPSLREAVVCRGLRLAQDRAAQRPGPGFSELQAKLRVGSFLRPLPHTTTATAALVMPLLNVALQIEPRWLDTPPVVETAFGDIPVFKLVRCPWLEKLDAQARAGDRTETLMIAAAMLEQHLLVLEQAYEVKRMAVWETLRDTEAIAADLLAAHLTANALTARRERERYLYPGRDLPRATDPEFVSLQAAVARVAAARRGADVDAVKREQLVVEAVALAITTLAVAAALQRGAVTLDRAAWDQIAYATKLTDQARANTAEAVTRYLQVLRREAARHPILLVLSHAELAGGTALALGRAIDDALKESGGAIETLRAEGANSETLPEQRRASDLTPSGMAERLSEAGRLSVWKLPFFVERALGHLPPERAAEVVAILQVAAETSEGAAIKQMLALFGIETSMMLAAAAGGPVGIGLALAWALFNLGGSIVEYQQLSALYHATLDPAVLLRGTDHEEAGKLGIVLDLIGLIVW